jgi:CBS domain-containing protein
MTVKAILSLKGTDVVTIEPNASVSAAMQQLTTRKIGALVITGADRRVIGILSERDIVHKLAEKGAEVLDHPLSEIMTRKVTTCSQTDTISSVMERMTQGKFRHLPVTDQGRLVGIVSIGDVVNYRLVEMEREQSALRDYIQTA